MKTVNLLALGLALALGTTSTLASELRRAEHPIKNSYIVVLKPNSLVLPANARNGREALQTLYAEEPRRASETTEEVPAEQPPREPCILVAEDNATNQEVVAMQLARLGADCVVVGQGKDALARLLESELPPGVFRDAAGTCNWHAIGNLLPEAFEMPTE